MTTTSAATAAAAPTIASSRVSPSTCTAPASSVRRSARSRSWSGDSSPLAYSTVRPAVSSRAAACSSSVDLPIPGSPPISVIDPGTMPPPSTKSNSSMPVRQRWSGVVATSRRRAGGRPDAWAAPPFRRSAVRAVRGATGSSATAFHAPHALAPAHPLGVLVAAFGAAIDRSRPRHGYSASSRAEKLSNRVYSRVNLSCTSPVGPLRFLASMISASPRLVSSSRS